MNNPVIPPSPDAVYTVKQVAKQLQLSKAQVYAMVTKGEIRHLKIGRIIRLRQADLNRWLEEQVRLQDLMAA